MRRITTTLGIVLLALACSETRSPVGPSPPAPSASPIPPLPTLTHVSGVVYEVTSGGRRPLAGVQLDISPEYQSNFPITESNAEGQFTVELVPRDGLKIVGIKTNYSQPCRLPVRAGVGDYEVYLVSNDILSTTGAPSSLPITAPVLTGRVFERTPAGEHPIAGASFVLDFSNAFGWSPGAGTVTDTTGHYLLCNVVDSTGFGVGAAVWKPGYDNASLDLGSKPPPTLDVELSRR